MALVRCPDCGREVFSEAPALLGCGRPMKSGAAPDAAPPPVPPPVAPPLKRMSDNGPPVISENQPAVREPPWKNVGLVLGLGVLMVLAASLAAPKHTPETTSSGPTGMSSVVMPAFTPDRDLLPAPARRWPIYQCQSVGEEHEPSLQPAEGLRRRQALRRFHRPLRRRQALPLQGARREGDRPLDHRGALAPRTEARGPENGDIVLDLPAGSLIEAKRFVQSLGRFGKALGPKELVREMAEEVCEMRKWYRVGERSPSLWGGRKRESESLIPVRRRAS